MQTPASQRRRVLQIGATALGVPAAPAILRAQSVPKIRVGFWPVAAGLPFFVAVADEVLLLTKRPTRVAEILRYGDPRPRTVDTLSQASLIATKKRSLEIFQQEVRR